MGLRNERGGAKGNWEGREVPQVPQPHGMEVGVERRALAMRGRSATYSTIRFHIKRYKLGSTVVDLHPISLCIRTSLHYAVGQMVAISTALRLKPTDRQTHLYLGVLC